MCWIGNNKPIIAEEDINCFKVMYIDKHDLLLSFYQKMYYNLNHEYKTKIKVKFPHNSYSRIEQGFHSYNYYCKITQFHLGGGVSVHPIERLINRTLDFYIKVPPDVVVVVDCIIPKGTLFYENELGEIVSENIILTKINETSNYGE